MNNCTRHIDPMGSELRKNAPSLREYFYLSFFNAFAVSSAK
jgi:hypothetical protein